MAGPGRGLSEGPVSGGQDRPRWSQQASPIARPGSLRVVSDRRACGRRRRWTAAVSGPAWPSWTACRLPGARRSRRGPWSGAAAGLTAMMCRTRLMRRFPARESRWRAWLPEDASSGAVPFQEANRSRLANRWTSAASASSRAAPEGPMPCRSIRVDPRAVTSPVSSLSRALVFLSMASSSPSARRQGFPGLPWCAGVPVRRACRTGTVPLAVELIEGHGAGGEREPRPGRPDAAGLGDRAPGWSGCRPGACGPRRSGPEAEATPASSSRPGFRQAAGRP